jgi:hypothetical protein
MRVVIAVIIGFAAGSSVLGQTSPYQRGTPVIPINRAPASESVVVTRNQAWQVQATDHFDIYHQASQPQIDAAALEAERAYARISANMDHELTARMPVILVANDADLPRTIEQAYRLVAASGAPIEAEHLWLSGETLAQRPYWMAHELTHPFLFELLPAPVDFAAWVSESLADHHSGAWQPVALAAVRDALTTGRVPAVENLAVSDRHWGHAVFDYIASQYGTDGVRRYIAVLSRRPQSGGVAIEEAFSTSPTEFNRAVEAYARSRLQ